MRAQVAQCREHVRALAELARRGAADEPAPEQAQAFVARCVDRWRLLRPSAEASLHNRAGDALLLVSPSLAQSLINLVNNAADANAATGESSPIEIEADVIGQWLVLRISDRGPGPERADTRQDEAAPGGLGMGLLVSRAGIDRHGGQVRHLARPGGGSVVEVDLPLAAST